MPRLSVWMIRTALLYLGAGFSFGALALWNKGVPISGDLWRLVGAHLDILFIGWTAQLAMGTAFWILPRFSTTTEYTQGRLSSRFGNVRAAWLAYGLLNAGVLLAVSGALAGVVGAVLIGRLCQVLAVVSFAVHAWPRVRPVVAQPAVAQPAATQPES
jgi:hypothetical protein